MTPPAPALAERVFNLLAGLSAFSWAILGALHDAALSPVRASLTLLHALAGWLFLNRARVDAHGSPGAILRALPSFVCAGAAFAAAPPPPLWPAPATGLFVLGALVTAASLTSLGSSFAVLPARRAVKTRGSYSLVRHPAYAGELSLVAACVLAQPSLRTLGLLIGAALGLALRIVAEEETLAGPEYQAYRERVRYRLLPGVW